MCIGREDSGGRMSERRLWTPGLVVLVAPRAREARKSGRDGSELVPAVDYLLPASADAWNAGNLDYRGPRRPVRRALGSCHGSHHPLVHLEKPPHSPGVRPHAEDEQVT